MKFNEILKSLRLEHHILQKELAAYLNISISTISNYEQGIHQPDLETLCRIADFYGVSTDFLLGRTKCSNGIAVLNQKICNAYTVTDLILFMRQLPTSARNTVVSLLKLLSH